VESTGLLVDLALSLLAAFVGAAIAVRLGQSPVVGYIVAGVAIGPFTPGFVGDIEVVASLADIGVVFLMFAIGARISLPALRRVGPVSVLGATIQVALCVLIGAGVGSLVGWGLLESLFFGAVISNSSSTVLSKVLGERGEADTEHALIGLGWSTVQDLWTIVLIVVLTAMAGVETTSQDVALALGRALIFLVIVLPIGSRVVPRLFEFLASFRSREIFILGIVTIALGTAYLGTFFGISLALGAFLAGVLVAESELSAQVVGETLPFRDLFAALFFVSIGMLVDPGFVIANVPLVLLILGLIVLVKGAIVTGIVALFRYPARTALLTGIVLAQSAEFSFLLARVGSESGAVGSTGFSLMLAGAAGSIVLAPALHQVGAPLARRVGRRLGSADPSPPEPTTTDGRRTAVICGYGRVGRLVAAVLERRGFAFVVVEEDPRVVRAARDQGLTVIRGSAENRVVLERALGGNIAVVVVALPDPLVVRTVVSAVRLEHPRLPIVARAYSASHRAELQRLGANAVIVGEIELGLEMTRFTLRQFGLSALEAQALISGLRRD
jgi:monovalent cation:H+ antiporter-2, CPA2 family